MILSQKNIKTCKINPFLTLQKIHFTHQKLHKRLKIIITIIVILSILKFNLEYILLIKPCFNFFKINRLKAIILLQKILNLLIVLWHIIKFEYYRIKIYIQRNNLLKLIIYYYIILFYIYIFHNSILKKIKTVHFF